MRQRLTGAWMVISRPPRDEDIASASVVAEAGERTPELLKIPSDNGHFFAQLARPVNRVEDFHELNSLT